MPKSRTRKNHKAALARRRNRNQKQEIIERRMMQKFISRQQEDYTERYNLNDSLGHLKEIELTDSKSKNFTEIEEFVQSIEDDYTRGFFSGRLGMLDDDVITAEEFVQQMEEAIIGKTEAEENEAVADATNPKLNPTGEVDAPQPESVDNVEGMHEEAIEELTEAEQAEVREATYLATDEEE